MWRNWQKKKRIGKLNEEMKIVDVRDQFRISVRVIQKIKDRDQRRKD